MRAARWAGQAVGPGAQARCWWRRAARPHSRRRQATKSKARTPMRKGKRHGEGPCHPPCRPNHSPGIVAGRCPEKRCQLCYARGTGLSQVESTGSQAPSCLGTPLAWRASANGRAHAASPPLARRSKTKVRTRPSAASTPPTTNAGAYEPVAASRPLMACGPKKPAAAKPTNMMP